MGIQSEKRFKIVLQTLNKNAIINITFIYFYHLKIKISQMEEV